MPRKFRGWFGHYARRRCPHSNVEGVYGDAIIAAGYFRLYCRDCGRYLAGKPQWASRRRDEML